MSSTPSPLPAKKSTLEITARVIILGLILSVVMGAANVYVGLKAGMTVSASIPAAVMAMLIFRLVLRRSSILEANQVQTCASAGESLAAGIIFTMPAMILIKHWEKFDYWTVSLVALTGGLLGILFMIPMRRVFVVNNDDLPYPEGLACAAVLESGEAGEANRSAAIGLILGGLLGAAFKFFSGFLQLIQGTLEVAASFGNRLFFFGGDLSPMLVGVGFIVRLNVAVLIFAGGAAAWLIGLPLMSAGVGGEDLVEASYGVWSTKIRYIGVGAMVMGGVASLVSVRHGLVAAIKALGSGLSGKQSDQPASDRDMPSKLILAMGIVCVCLLAALNYRFTGNAGISVVATVIMVLLGFFFTAVASYIVGLVGNSNSPVSGMTITAVLAAGCVMVLFRYSGTEAMVATLGIAAVVCCVACTAGDVCNDLKTGSLVGAKPYRQQFMQIAGVAVAAFVMAPVLTLLHENTPGGIGGDELSAPQASLFASLAEGFAGERELPWGLIGVGAGIGVLVLILDGFLKAKGSKFRAHLMPIAVGMYLPFGLSVPILCGGLIAHLYSRGCTPRQTERRLYRGVLFASGVIAGEALTAVGLAGLAALGVSSLALGFNEQVVIGVSIVAAIAILASYLVMGRPDEAALEAEAEEATPPEDQN